MPVARMLLVALCLVLAGCANTTPSADITITAAGCATSFVLPPEREPLISVVNRAADPMVLTLPTLNRWVALAPGQQADFELPRYIMGSFDFFCLTEADHTVLGGSNPFLCSLEPAQVAPLARSGGIFEIAQHNRIQELVGAPKPAD